MDETNTDLVVLGPSGHMTWLSGLDPHGDERTVMLMISKDYAGLIIPALNADAARQHTDMPFHVWNDEEGPEAALCALIDKCNLPDDTPNLVLDECMRADFALSVLAVLPKARHRFTDDTLGVLRASKDAQEFMALKASALLNDRAVVTAFDALKPGITELDVQNIIHAVYKAENTTPEFTIVAFGANSALPHHHTGPTILTDNMPVLIDTGCRLQGYPSDMTRCTWFGTADPEYLRIYGILEQAVSAAVAAAKPGVLAKTVDQAARTVITNAGYGGNFPHRTGHGVGINIHELPYITATSNTVLQEGHVFSIEPGIYLENTFGIRLEDVVILRKDHAEILSGLPINMPQ